MAFGDTDYSQPANLPSPLRAIRLKCRDCMADQVAAVARCEVSGCSLWPYRMGKRPGTAGVWESVGKGAPGNE